MRIQDVRLGTIYRFKEHPSSGYAKVIAILKPGEGVNKSRHAIVKCEHTIRKHDRWGFTRYFLPSALIRET